jgi:hypothetical protein
MSHRDLVVKKLGQFDLFVPAEQLVYRSFEPHFRDLYFE